MGLLMIALAVSQLVYLYLGVTTIGWISVALVLAVPVLGRSEMKLREYYLLAVSLGLLAIVTLTRNDAGPLIGTGLNRAAYLTAFILLMGFLREGAVTSPSIAACGRHITHQPPKRRFVAVFSGAHFFSVMINLGSMSLLAPIIQRGVRGDRQDYADLDLISQVREQRQLSAALRGFAWFLIWAPTAVTQAILPTLIPGIDPFRLMGLGLSITAAMLVLGWLEDAIRWQPLRRRLAAAGTLPNVSKSGPPWKSFGNLALVCASLFALTFVFLQMASVTVVTGVMLATPIVVVVWIHCQQAGGSPDDGSLAERLGKAVFVSMPGFVREAVFIGCAGFIGTLAAALVPADQLAAALDLGRVPGWQILSALSLAVLLAGQIGLSPITMAVFLGSVYAELPFSPVDPTLAALAIAAGTAIASTGAPFASAVAMLARVSGHDTFTLTWRWNGVFTLMSVSFLVLIYMMLT
jgi:hypothetical protein